jgi:hypothetical protein
LSIAFSILLLSGCGDDPVLRLNKLLESDLTVILTDIDKDSVLDEPRFEIVEFNSFDEGKFRHLAEVHFYFLKDINVKIVRKYRYNRRHFRWELFHNVYERY